MPLLEVQVAPQSLRTTRKADEAGLLLLLCAGLLLLACVSGCPSLLLALRCCVPPGLHLDPPYVRTYAARWRLETLFTLET